MFNLKNIPENDKDAMQLISDGKTKGIFQLESHLAKTWAKKIKPNCSEELSDLISLIRPGAISQISQYVSVKNGENTPVYVDKRLEKILSPSKGFILYQETISQILIELAGYSPELADIIRSHIGKKRADKLNEELPKVKVALVKNGMSETGAQKLVDIIKDSGSYSFNRSHSFCYQKLGQMGSFLKSHYPIVFFYSNLCLSCEKGGKQLDEIRELYYDAKDFGIDILPPSIDTLTEDFEIIDNNTIRFGFMHIKGMGKTGIGQLKKVENKNTWEEFFHEIIKKKVKKNVIEAIIKCGALDKFNIPRCKMLYEFEIVGGLTAKQREVFIEKYSGDIALAIESINEENKRLRINDDIAKMLDVYKNRIFFDYLTTKDIWEREHLGINMSSSRLDEYQDEGITHDLSMVNGALDREEIVVIALLEKVKKTKTKKNKEDMAFLTLSDIKTEISNCIIFPELFRDAYYGRNILKESGEVLKISGYKSINDRGESFIATGLEKLG